MMSYKYLCAFRRNMIWTREHDIVLVREILNLRPWQHKSGSVERGQTWELIAAVLNSLDKPVCKVTQRSVRDRYVLLAKKFKQKTSEENRASGISPEPDETDDALLDITEQFDEADLQRQNDTKNKKMKNDADLATAQDIRKTSLETFSQTKKRKEDEEAECSKRPRRSSDATVSYLQEKSERDFELRKQELALKEREIALQEKTREAQFTLMAEQNAMMLEVIKKLKN